MKPPKKNPCKACPFLKTSPRGYLGGHSVEEFMTRWRSEQVMECHKTVDYESDVDYLEQIEEGEHVHACAGASIMMTNDCRLPRNRDYPKLPGSAKVFRNPTEFTAHHDTPFHRAFIASERKRETP